MPWLRVDDQFADNTKVAPLSNSAFRLHVQAMCYASSQLTDGFIPVGLLPRLGWTSEDVEDDVRQLAEQGLWERVDGGYTIHDFLEYNPCKADVLREREAAKERMRRARSGEVRENITQTSTKVPPSPSPSPSPSPIKDPTTTAAGPEPASEKLKGETAALYSLIEKSGVIVASSLQGQEWDSLLDITHDMKLIEEAFGEPAKQGKRPSPAYIRSILERCVHDGVRPGAWAGGKPGARASPRQSVVLDEDAVAELLAEQAQLKEQWRKKNEGAP